jgi:hypothetical protein
MIIGNSLSNTDVTYIKDQAINHLTAAKVYQVSVCV